MISTALNIHSRQIQRYGVKRREQLVCEFFVEVFGGTLPFGGTCDEASQ